MILGAAILAAISLAASRGDASGACIPASVIAAQADCSAAAASPTVPVADVLAAAAQLQSRAGSGSLPGAKSQRKLPVSPPAARELDDAEKKLGALFHRFLCVDKPAPGDVKQGRQHAEIEYALARLYFGANHFAEAAATFRDIARLRSDTPVGVHASQLYLESLNVLGHPDTPSCYDDMARDVPVFIGLYCKDGKESVNVDQCGVMSRIQRDILRLTAETRIKEADRGGPDASTHYEAGAVIYLQIWDQYGKAGCEAKSAACERMEEVLYNAARAYQAARKIDKAIAVRKVMIEPRYNLQNTELAKRTPYEIGSNYHAMAIHDEAATWYERFARTSPGMSRASDALADAIVLRLALGQGALADADADLFNKNYGSKLPGMTAKIAIAVAMYPLDRGDFEAASRRLSASMAQIDRSATIDIRIMAHGALGRALAALHKQPEAAAEYARVRALYRDPAAVIEKMRRDSGGDSDERRLAKILTAVRRWIAEGLAPDHDVGLQRLRNRASLLVTGNEAAKSLDFERTFRHLDVELLRILELFFLETAQLAVHLSRDALGKIRLR